MARVKISNRALLFGTVIVQLVCVFYFVSDILLSLLGLPPLNWTFRELVEIGASIGLLLGLIATTLLIRRTTRRADAVEGQLRLASGAFMELLEERFAHWRLTPAERDVALFVIKGLSTSDIASLRTTSEGTVKAQTNAIYRKAGVSGRPQLLSLFIEDLIAGPVVGSKTPEA